MLRGNKLAALLTSMYKTNLYLLVVLALLIPSCGIFEKTPDYIGRIDDRLPALLETLPKDATLIIRSGGGNVKASGEAGLLILEKDINLILKDRCMSACSEFLIPASKSVTFVGAPLIGFHWSPIMDRAQFQRHEVIKESCGFPQAIIQEKLLTAKGLNKDFWTYIEDKLVLTHYRLHDVGKPCLYKSRNFMNRTWLPTSIQLRELWGLEFTGSVCADDIDTCIGRINEIYDPGTRIAIGDYVHTVVAQ